MKTKTVYTDILSKIAERNSSGIEALYMQYSKQFRGYVMTQWKFDEDAAWEVIYQTLEALVLKLPSYTFNSQVEFDRLVFKFFLNFVRQYYRKHQSKREIQWVSLNDSQGSNNIEFDEKDNDTFINTVEEFYDSDEIVSPNLEKLDKCLEQLNTIDRELLLLRAREYSYEQIAKMLEIENNQLNVKYLRAKQKLIKLFNQLP
jgi:RNA polymerase sigma factor (sigma-70 family)